MVELLRASSYSTQSCWKSLDRKLRIRVHKDAPIANAQRDIFELRLYTDYRNLSLHSGASQRWSSPLSSLSLSLRLYFMCALREHRSSLTGRGRVESSHTMVNRILYSNDV